MDPETANSPRDLDDLFDYDVGLEDIPDGNSAQVDPAEGARPLPKGSSALGLGLDEEVKVSKKRQPVAKLDESRQVFLRPECLNLVLTASQVCFHSQEFLSCDGQRNRSSDSKEKATR